ncbi:MAG: hypothetical protein ABSB42_06960 [Tepidisphaeraceae bacterium]|jgi:hypothetical protein
MLQKIAASLVCIAWALWFGGLGALFLFVTDLFAKDRPTALTAAPQMFLVFERYQILLAAAALLGVVAWRILAGSIRVTVLFVMLAAATIPAALGPMLLTSRMEQLRQQGQSSSPEFRKLHGISMIVYSGQTLILLAAGLTLPWAMREQDKTTPAPPP